MVAPFFSFQPVFNAASGRNRTSSRMAPARRQKPPAPATVEPAAGCQLAAGVPAPARRNSLERAARGSSAALDPSSGISLNSTGIRAELADVGAEPYAARSRAFAALPGA